MLSRTDPRKSVNPQLQQHSIANLQSAYARND